MKYEIERYCVSNSNIRLLELNDPFSLVVHHYFSFALESHNFALKRN